MGGVGANSGSHEAFFERGPELLFIASIQGMIVRLNGAARQVLGPEVTGGTPFLEWVHPDDRERVATDWSAIAQSRAGERARWLCRLRIGDGSYRTFSLSALRSPVSEEIHGVIWAAAPKAAPVPVSSPRYLFKVIE